MTASRQAPLADVRLRSNRYRYGRAGAAYRRASPRIRLRWPAFEIARGTRLGPAVADHEHRPDKAVSRDNNAAHVDPVIDVRLLRISGAPHMPDERFDIGSAHHPGPQQNWLIARNREHRGFDSHAALAAVEDQVDRIAKRRRTCPAVRQEFGEAIRAGAAMGIPASRSSMAIGCAGIRKPTVSSPAVTRSGISDLFGTTSVSGPGQKACEFFGLSGQCVARYRAVAIHATCTIRGLLRGRPFASKMRPSLTHRARLRQVRKRFR